MGAEPFDHRGVLDLTAAHFWDITSVNALDRVVLKFRHHGIPVDVGGTGAGLRRRPCLFLGQ
jgi:MFS superfamily sulfate permease-like transporter